jgi:hypothetical protein
MAAREFKIFTPSGKLAGNLVKAIIDGYEPKRHQTRLRCGLPEELPYCPTCRRRVVHKHDHPADEIPDEPIRRVLTGAWRTPDGRWVSPEEKFGQHRLQATRTRVGKTRR